MAHKRFNAEQIVNKLRESDVLLGYGLTVAVVCKRLEITHKTCCRWRKEYGGLKVDQTKRLTELEKENARLKHLLAEAHLDKRMLQEVASGKW